MVWVSNMLQHTGATKEDFTVRASDGVILRGWKVRPPAPNGNWVLHFHGIADNRTGNSGHGEFSLRHGYSVVMMDARARRKRRRHGYFRLEGTLRHGRYHGCALRERKSESPLRARRLLGRSHRSAIRRG